MRKKLIWQLNAETCELLIEAYEKALEKSMNPKVAIVTGGNSQIGKACAARLASEDYQIILVATKFQNEGSKYLEDTEYKKKYQFEEANIYKRDQVNALMEKVYHTFGRLDVLVNNPVSYSIYDSKSKAGDSLINKNFKGQLNCAQIASRYMKKNKYGKIINFSMITCFKALNDLYYYIAEAEIAGMTKFLAQKLGAHNIHVNCIALGTIDLSSLKEVASEENISQMIKACPLKRIGKIQDVANAVFFLATDESTFITGNVLHISGGLA